MSVAAFGLGCGGAWVPTAPDDDDPGVDGGGGSGGLAFRPTIQADLDGRGCAAQGGCHGGSAPMPLQPSPASEDAWQENYAQVSARAGTAASSLLLDKATGAGGHVALLDGADETSVRWAAWIASGAPYDVATVADAGPPADADVAAGSDAGPAPPTWAQVAPLLAARGCVGCHGGAGSYSLESYAAAFGQGSDGIPNVIPGNPLSLLVNYCEQGHYGMPYAEALVVLRWVVDAGAIEN